MVERLVVEQQEVQVLRAKVMQGVRQLVILLIMGVPAEELGELVIMQYLIMLVMGELVLKIP